jgi:hypothetical protein
LPESENDTILIIWGAHLKFTLKWLVDLYEFPKLALGPTSSFVSFPSSLRCKRVKDWNKRRSLMVTSPRLTWRVLEVMKATHRLAFSERDIREPAHQDSTICFLPKCRSLEWALLTCIIDLDWNMISFVQFISYFLGKIIWALGECTFWANLRFISVFFKYNCATCYKACALPLHFHQIKAFV